MLRVKESVVVVQGVQATELRRRETDRSQRSRAASIRDLPTIACFRTGSLLRRNGPVPGILAANRSGAMVDKSERRCVGAFMVAPVQRVSVCGVRGLAEVSHRGRGGWPCHGQAVCPAG